MTLTSSPEESLRTNTPRASHSGVSVLENLEENGVSAASAADDMGGASDEIGTTPNNNIMTSSPQKDIVTDGDAGTAVATNNDQQQLGGSTSSPAYALLVGVALENESKILSIPINTLPTTIGKEHETKDSSFIGLTEYNSSDAADGSKSSGPKLSKSMCCIYYRDGIVGGKLGCYKKKKKKSTEAGGGETAEGGSDEIMIEGDVDALDGMTYIPYEKEENEDNAASDATPNDIIRLPSMKQSDPLPQNGFYAIECTGRKIVVGGKALKKGQHAMLSDGITIKIATHCFYFLLPKNTTPNTNRSIKITMMKSVEKNKKRDNSSDDSESSDDDSTNSVIKSLSRPAKKSKTAIDDLESKTDAQLMEMLDEATQNEGWDKNSQNIGTTLATRACRAAASSSKLQKINMDSSGVTQRDIQNYLSNDSETFREYETMMLRKIESKSFVIAMAKAIIRAGYIKSDVKSGRANRWGLPSDIVPVMAKVEPPLVKKSPSLLKLPNSGAKSKKNPMALPKATDLSKVTAVAGETVAMDNVDKPEKKEDDLKTRVESWFARPANAEVATTLLPNLNQKEEMMKEFDVDKKKLESLLYRMRKKLKQKQEAEGVVIASEGGDGSGGGGGVEAPKKESGGGVDGEAPKKKDPDLKTLVESWLARPENAQVATTLQPNLNQKEEIMKEFGADKKKLESLFYRMRKKLKKKQEEEGGNVSDGGGGWKGVGAMDPDFKGGADTSSEPEVAKPAVPGAATDATPSDQSKSAAPVNKASPTASAPPPGTGATAAATSGDKITQLEHQNHVYSHALNEALQMGSPLKEATERAAAAAAAAAAVVERKS